MSIELFNQKRVFIFGDNDKPGVAGSKSVAREVFPYASEVKVIQLDGEITETAGKDIRDVMNENQQAGIDYQTTVAGLLNQAEETPAYEIQQDEPESDESSKDQPAEESQLFPVECLPSVLGEYVTAGSKSLRCDPSFIVIPLLVVIASLIGASRVLRPAKDWKVPAILWGVVIADSGSMKSPAMRMATEPLYKLQAKAHVRNREVMDEYKLREAIYDTKMKDFVKELARGEGPPPDEPEKPDEPRIIDKIVGDVTLERLAYIINHNPKGIPIVKDEISGLIGNLNKYTGSKGSDEAVLLEGYNLGTMQVHRKHDPCDIFVPNAAISIAGNTQPKTYQRMMDSSYRESGFMSRFLKAYPPRTVKAFPGEGIPDEIKEALMKLVELLDQFQPVQTEEGAYQPESIYLTGEALQAYKRFHQWHNTEAATMTGDLSAEWSKLEEIPLRLSLIFHCIECVTSGRAGERVSAETMDNAIQITEWFKNESLRVYRLFDSENAEGSEQQREQKRLIEFIRGKGGTVSVRETQQGMRYKTADDTEKALGELVKNSVAEWVNIPRKRKGRPSRGISLTELKQCNSETLQSKTSGFYCSVTDELVNERENDNSQPISEQEATPEQTAKAAPENLGDFMNHLDDEIPF